jgi:hypothetical protein
MKKKVVKKVSKASEVVKKTPDFNPKFVTMAADRTRRNAAADIERTNKFINIENGITPFSSSEIGGQTVWGAQDAIILCQKAYYNFPVFKNVIDLMTEFSINAIYFKGGNKKSRDFHEALWKSLGLWSLLDKFYREFYRSGTVPLYRYETDINAEEIRKITQVYGEELSLTGTKKLPVRYVILNPADIRVGGTVSFAQSSYYQILNSYEIERLRNAETDEEKALLQALPPKTRDQIKKQGSNGVLLPLDPQKLRIVFNKRQDYEPMALPMGYGVLADINWKEEMKRIDMAVSRTMQQVILLITMGAKPDDGGINHKNLEAMETLFASETVSRTLIADYTTKATWLVPEVADFLDPKKYQQIDNDIRTGLNDILVGGEKFANQSIKVKIFIERLRQGREAFLNEFFIPEVKRISKEMGFKNYPIPYFHDIDLKNEEEWDRFITRLVEIGALTPEEAMEAFDSGKLPDAESSVESQRKLKAYKDEGLYQPVLGGPADQKDIAEMTNEAKLEQVKMGQAGRPNGTGGIKQKTRKVTPIGGSEEPSDFPESYSIKKFTENIILADKVVKKIEASLIKKFKLKKLNTEQIDIAGKILEAIVANESTDKWAQSIDKYLESPIDTNPEKLKEINQIAASHNIDYYLASILHASKAESVPIKE